MQLDLPHNIEAEMGVLGSVLLDGRDVFDDVATIVQPADFYRFAHELVFRAFEALAAEMVPIDLTTVADRLTRDGKFCEVGGNDFLVEVIGSVPHSAHAPYYADIVRQKAVHRELIAAATEIIGDARSNQFTGDDLIERSETRVFAVGEQRQSGEIATAVAAADDTEARWKERKNGVIPGIATGLADFDEMTGGLQPGFLYVLAARPSIGKTALGLNIAEHVSMREQIGVLFISLEMTRGELGDRLTCGLAGVDSQRFMHPDRLTREEDRRIVDALRCIRGARLFIDDAPARTIGEICSIARRHRSREGIGLVVVDYLQLVEVDPGRHGMSRQEQVAQMSRRFKGLAKSLDIPVMLLSQLNRNAENRENKRPQLADIRESGAVEQDANTVLLLHRPEFHDPNELPGQAVLIVAKNRGGQTGDVNLRFQKSTFRFSDLQAIDPSIF